MTWKKLCNWWQKNLEEVRSAGIGTAVLDVPPSPIAVDLQFQFVDHSAEVFGKYQYCTSYDGVMYADSDFVGGRPKVGAIPSPSEDDRTPFGQKRKPVLETEAMKFARWERQKEETHELLEHLAQELLPQAIEDEAGWIDKAIAEYEADKAGYRFEAKMHGGFLTVRITRAANPQTEAPFAFFGQKPMPTQYADTFCVSGCAMPSIIVGHGPDMLGETTFGYRCKQIDGGGITIGGTNFGNYAAPVGYRWVVLPPRDCSFSRTPHGRPLFHVEPPPQPDAHNVIHIPDTSYRIKTRVKPAARFAGDDRVMFRDIGRTIYAPFGMGEMVLDTILTAMKAP